jgi:hypothetical protein
MSGQEAEGEGAGHSAQIDEPASPAKLELIRRYLRATGLQGGIDTGRFLHRYTIFNDRLTAAMTNASGRLSLRDFLGGPQEAVRQAYEPYRHIWQEEYERHLNWEYTEDELRQIVAFLESDAGRHYRMGDWRMRAYVDTNTEHLIEQIIDDTEAILRSGKQPVPPRQP